MFKVHKHMFKYTCCCDLFIVRAITLVMIYRWNEVQLKKKQSIEATGGRVQEGVGGGKVER